MNYNIWSAQAIERLSEMSNLPLDSIYSPVGVVIAESMTYVEAVLALLL